MAYPGLAHEEHKYLGKEYCTGYTDVYGKWNTGFYCPQYGSKTAVFCCGTAVFKYCCTNQEPVDSTSSGGVLLDGDDPNFGGDGVSSAVFVRVPIVFGVVCGIAAVLILLVVAACYFCSCCFAYKKRRDDPRDHHGLPTSLYRTSNSTTSNLLNLYSPAALTTNSLVSTPLDLDWAALAHASGPSSIASSYQSQQLYPPLQFQHGMTPAIAAAAALSQRSSHSPSPSTLLYNNSSSGGGVSGTPSVISGTATSNRFQQQNPALSAYNSFLNSSTSTLASRSGGIVPSTTGPPVPQATLHRGNLPQQISTTASIVNSYLASLQQAHLQNQPPAEQPPPPSRQAQPLEHTRHPSPPPPYFQIAPSYQTNNNNGGGRAYTSNNNPQNNRARMATVQSILGGAGGTSNISGNSTNEDDLNLTEFLLRNEDYLRRTLRLGVSSSNANRSNGNPNGANNYNNSTRPNSNSRSNTMLTQRELIELLLRLTYNVPPSSSTGSISRSDSRAGSDSTSTASRSTTSSLKSCPTASTTGSNGNGGGGGGTGSGGKILPATKLTISEVDEEDDRTATTINIKSAPGLDLSLSRISDNDSGVPSSTCSTAGSESSAVIRSIKVIPRDVSEEALKLKKQHAVDDDGDHLPSFTTSSEHRDDDDDLVGSKKLHQQQLLAIHSETTCTTSPATNNGFAGGGLKAGDDGVLMESSTPSPIQVSDDHIAESVSTSVPTITTVPTGVTVPSVPCDNVISPTTAQI